MIRFCDPELTDAPGAGELYRYVSGKLNMKRASSVPLKLLALAILMIGFLLRPSMGELCSMSAPTAESIVLTS